MGGPAKSFVIGTFFLLHLIGCFVKCNVCSVLNEVAVKSLLWRSAEVLHLKVVIDLFIHGLKVCHACCEVCTENEILVCAVRHCLLQLEMFKP